MEKKRQLAPSLQKLVSGSGSDSGSNTAKAKKKTTTKSILDTHNLVWYCKKCKNPCLVTTSESRCLCGHRHREHNYRGKRSKCSVYKCKCVKFFYIVAQGAFILRCRCKHKHTEHDPSKTARSCLKRNCDCEGFDSPFVCNCNHGWKDHVQKFLPKIKRSNILPPEVGNPTMVKRGLEEEEEEEN